MILAVITKSKSADKPVADLINKITLCKYYGWTPKEYDEQRISDIRKFKTYMELMSEKNG